MSSTIVTSADKVMAAKMINNDLFGRMVEKSIAAASLEAEWCKARAAAPDAGSTRAAFERKAGALRRLGNWKRGLSELADKITAAQTALQRDGQDKFEVAATAAYKCACEFKYAVDCNVATAAVNGGSAGLVNSLAEALERAYAKTK